MDAGKMGNWLQVGANLGIILGLVLVGFQLKQNTDLLRVQLLYEESQSFINHERQMMGDNPAEAWAKALENPEGLSPAEFRVMDAYLYAMSEQWRASHRLRELGILNDEWKDRLVEEASFYLGNPFGRAWWNLYRREIQLPVEMVEIVEEELKASPDYTLWYRSQLMDELSAPDD